MRCMNEKVLMVEDPQTELCQAEKNLLLFLDPAQQREEQNWDFQRIEYAWGAKLPSFLKLGRKVKVVYFSRRAYMTYLRLILQNVFFGRCGPLIKVFYFNHGLHSCFCHAGSLSGYRIFLRNNVSGTRSLKRKLLSLFPLSLRADARYLIFEPGKNSSIDEKVIPSAIIDNDLMIYSNATGKLLLIKSQTLCSGQGQVVKTSSNSDYLSVMEREFLCLKKVSALIGQRGYVPSAGERYEIKGRIFFTEQYIKGASLRDILFGLAPTNATGKVLKILDQLEAWYHIYSTTFSGTPRSLTFLYAPVLDHFEKLYNKVPEVLVLTSRIKAELQQLSDRNPGLVPALAHNDLWPGNFLVHANGLVAIDWERATPGRCGLFDFFWMVISTAIVFLMAQKQMTSCGEAFRKILSKDDSFSLDVISRLQNYLNMQGFDPASLDFFLLLFLVEWSIQGHQALGKQTDMDHIAFGELLHFVKQAGTFTPSSSRILPESSLCVE